MAVEKGKELARKAFDKGKQIAVDKTRSLATAAGEKAASLAQKVPSSVKDRISEIASSPAVKKVLTDKAKQILNSDSTAILSNLIAGSGVKRIR